MGAVPELETRGGMAIFEKRTSLCLNNDCGGGMFVKKHVKLLESISIVLAGRGLVSIHDLTLLSS